MGAYAGWELADLKAGVLVGLMDNGVQNDHEELDGKIRHLSGEYSTDYPNPDSCHGTATASIIAAKKNGKGIRGIADNAEIISVGIYEREMDGTAVVTFLEYREIIKQMIENGASIICLEAALSIFDANDVKKDFSCPAWTIRHRPMRSIWKSGIRPMQKGQRMI